eukprot:CAMPEP_0180506006 /NCGR_PEP_ID=MMETSP1036_2-20121128/47704_1 /TAXON_ID=632150 /ORGANISM="Azadinium spinosum, Strain 3D9" /LENGTH=128 /DNA_ID=CAMNT_0022515809 /DNA_START=275 /DNA_END=661 /DNA_ORIENTATION=+
MTVSNEMQGTQRLSMGWEQPLSTPAGQPPCFGSFTKSCPRGCNNELQPSAGVTWKGAEPSQPTAYGKTMLRWLCSPSTDHKLGPLDDSATSFAYLSSNGSKTNKNAPFLKGSAIWSESRLSAFAPTSM